MKKFDQFVNENRSKELKDHFKKEKEKAQHAYEEKRKPFRALIEPIENYIESTFNMIDVEVKIYKEDLFAEDLFTISVTCPFPDTYAIDDISKCVDSTMKNVQTLKDMETLEKTFEAAESSNNYLNSTQNRFKFYVLMEKIDSNFYTSLKGLNKFKL